MKKINFFILFLGISLMSINKKIYAQIVSDSTLYRSLGGAKKLNAQKQTTANPIFDFPSNLGLFTSGFNNGGGVNGVTRPLATKMNFSTSSTEKMRIISGGNIGVETTNPIDRLTHDAVRLEHNRFHIY